ncbi:hypothetical protein A4A49_21369 [Nicotiana attenuata]|uniref:Uncharacterized protein n=1 Tax=Nicotiana attenuata TaxID=49451 RepID=A0A314L1W2_NICAT|nr:hypothetical protein A4A49_21369 [Nicotiana attenuata]
MNLKGLCSIGLIEDTRVLIKLSLMGDYIHLLSKPAFYVKVQGEIWKMRCTKWSPWWSPDVETPIAITWISFRDLPPNLFGKDFVFSLANAVELHKKFNEEGDDQGKEKEVVARSDVIRTATNTSKVLSSGKVLGKHIPNPAKQEWMQRRNNRFHRDKNGHIIEAASQNEGDKLKGKAKEYEIVTKNSFDGLEVEESDKTILRITEGKGEENSKDKSQEKGKDQAKKGKEKENLNNSENPNHTSNGSGSREAGKEGIPNPKGEGINKLQDLIHVKKEAVEKVLEKEKSGNHSPTPTGKGTKAAINGVGDGCINIFDGSSPGLLAMGGIEEDVNMKFRDDTMESYQKIGKGKGSDPNGTVFSAQTTTVFPELGSVYELQFKIMQAIVSSMEQNKGNEHAKEQFEQAIVPRSAEEVKAVPMACESGTDQIIQLQLNVSLKTPF